MLKWLKKLFRWFVPKRPTPAPSCIIKVMRNGKMVEAHASSIMGAYLLCHFDGGSELIGEGSAVDQDHFRRLWAHLGGGKATWEDGTPYLP